MDDKIGIGISLDGFGSIDGEQRGIPDHFDRVLKLIKLCKDNKIPFSVESTLTKLNIDTLLIFRKLMMHYGFSHTYNIASESRHYYRNKGDLDFALDSSDIPKVEALRVGEVTAYSYFLPEYMRHQRQLFPCSAGFSSFFLNAVGDLYPCIHLNTKIGNIREEEFGKLWTGREDLGKMSKLSVRAVRKRIHDKGCHCWTGCKAENTLHHLGNLYQIKWFRTLGALKTLL